MLYGALQKGKPRLFTMSLGFRAYLLEKLSLAVESCHN